MIAVAWFPKSADLADNPYWPILQGELEKLDVRFSRSQASFWMSRRWLVDNRSRVQVLHFHFVQPMYAIGDDRVSGRRVLRFASDLLLARALGYRLVWTVHDLMPTWPKEPKWVEVLARRVIAHAAHDIVVHCREARRLVGRRFWRWRRVHVHPLPGYQSLYPMAKDKSVARRALGFPDERFVFAFVGGIRPNKGIEDLITAYQDLRDPDSLLVIAGRPFPPESYVAALHARAASNANVVFLPEAISDEEMPSYLAAADVLVFPFKRVLTSSSVMLAMSSSRPVVVPRLGCLPELVGTEAGFQYSPGSHESLVAALREARSGSLDTMGAAASRRAQDATWRDLARLTREVYLGGR